MPTRSETRLALNMSRSVPNGCTLELGAYAVRGPT